MTIYEEEFTPIEDGEEKKYEEEYEKDEESSYKVTHKFYIAGVQHHQMYKVMKKLEKGFFLFLIPEPTNKYDPNAIKITFPVSQEDVMLGYVPKRFSSEVSAAIELGKTLECVIVTLNKSAKPWEQCEVEIREFEEVEDIEGIEEDEETEEIEGIE